LDSPWPTLSHTSLRLFSNSQFFDCRTRMCTGMLALPTKKSLLLHRWLKSARFFSHTYLLRSRLTSNHGVPMGNPHSGVLVTYARIHIHSGSPRNKNCTSSTSKCLRVWAKNILRSSLMMAHMAVWGKQDVVAYATERSLTNTGTRCKRAVVSLKKARIIFTNRRKKTKPHQTKIGEIYPSG
jgi:hypothetical protein